MPIKLIKSDRGVCIFEQLKAGDSFMHPQLPNDLFIKTASRYKPTTGVSGEYNCFNAVSGNFAFFNGSDDVIRVNATLNVE